MSKLQLFQAASRQLEPQPEPQPQLGWDWTVDSKKTHLPVCKRYSLAILLEVGSPKRAMGVAA